MEEVTYSEGIFEGNMAHYFPWVFNMEINTSSGTAEVEPQSLANKSTSSDFPHNIVDNFASSHSGLPALEAEIGLFDTTQTPDFTQSYQPLSTASI